MTPEPQEKPRLLTRCVWCGKRNRPVSEWEQRTTHGAWCRLCVRCANRRLSNPLNSLLEMRKVKPHPFSRDYNGVMEFPKSGRQRGEGDG